MNKYNKKFQAIPKSKVVQRAGSVKCEPKIISFPDFIDGTTPSDEQQFFKKWGGKLLLNLSSWLEETEATTQENIAKMIEENNQVLIVMDELGVSNSGVLDVCVLKDNKEYSLSKSGFDVLNYKGEIESLLQSIKISHAIADVEFLPSQKRKI